MQAPQPMSTADRALALSLDALINAQATALIVDSEAFRPVRERAERKDGALAALLNCSLCSGMWVALGQALWAEQMHPPYNPTRFLRSAFIIACAGRIVRRLTDVPL